MSEEIDSLLKELKETKNLGSFYSPKQAKPTEVQKIEEEDLCKFIIDKSTKLIQQGVDTIEELKNSVLSGNPEEVSSFSELIKAVTSSLDVLSKINIQNKKSKSARELKELDINALKQLKDKPTRTNILVATREDVINRFLKDVENQIEKTSVIDIVDPKEEQQPKPPIIPD